MDDLDLKLSDKKMDPHHKPGIISPEKADANDLRRKVLALPSLYKYSVPYLLNIN